MKTKHFILSTILFAALSFNFHVFVANNPIRVHCSGSGAVCETDADGTEYYGAPWLN